MLAIKICGLTNLDDARWALEAGADYLGFVLYPKSPRAITVNDLIRISDDLPETTKKVGVFVNETPILVKQVARVCGLTAIQLHGDEAPLDFTGTEVPIWKAIRFQDRKWTPAPAAWAPERFVMDAASPAFGGTGTKVDWDAARQFAAGHRAMLAGGLDPETVGAAIRLVRPLGVDVASGVELAPGRKDHKKVVAFIRAAREAEKEMMNYE